MQILVKCFGRIIFSKNVSFGRKMSAYWFFFRYILFAVISLVVLAIPPIILWVEHWHWGWETYYFIVSVNLALAVYLYVTPLSVLYLLFSVAIGYFKTWAMVAGLLGSKKSKSWKVRPGSIRAPSRARLCTGPPSACLLVCCVLTLRRTMQAAARPHEHTKLYRACCTCGNPQALHAWVTWCDTPLEA